MNKIIAEMNKRRNDTNKTDYNNYKARLESMQKDFARFAELQNTEIPKNGILWTQLEGEIGKVNESIQNNIDTLDKLAKKATEDAIEASEKAIKEFAKDLKQKTQDNIDAIETEKKAYEKSKKDEIPDDIDLYNPSSAKYLSPIPLTTIVSNFSLSSFE
jgi:septin family protein